MFIEQLTVFVENREGHVADILEVLANKGINLLSLTLADSADYGLLRLVVEDPENAKAILKEAGYTASITKVLAIKLSNTVGSLKQLLSKFDESNINIDYMYVLSLKGESVSVVIKTKDADAAGKLLEAQGVEFVTASDLI
ncbi:MAG: amino acid-binding protein [Lachnospiraceae bacterium]|nr:amino acid-binding protein [Lachnospiraceae bacterium]